ncbi:MAG TPA: hypothetical protein V6C81_21345 [Planktothrix sp.]|jgi:hypothetical protein
MQVTIRYESKMTGLVAMMSEFEAAKKDFRATGNKESARVASEAAMQLSDNRRIKSWARIADRYARFAN